jgi:hypothetical protein
VAETIHRLIELPTGYASQTVARYVWQLDDQTRRLFEPSAWFTPEALEWQPGPGHNTMGMLFAHVAVAETHMAAVLLEGRADSDVRGVLGIGPDDDGLPLPADGLPPAVLADRTIEWYRDLVGSARAETKRVARGLTDADLDRRVTRHPEDGSTRIYNVDWSFYHIVEHLAGHRAQIHQLQHLYEERDGA